jgi:hypothetical protein
MAKLIPWRVWLCDAGNYDVPFGAMGTPVGTELAMARAFCMRLGTHDWHDAV